MSREHTKELFNIVMQILPFLMVTVVFIGFSYTYGHTHLMSHEESVADVIKLSCNCLP